MLRKPLKFYLILLSVLLSCQLNLSAKVDKSNENQSHHATWGARGQRDVHLGKFTITERYEPLKVISKDFEYKPKVLCKIKNFIFKFKQFIIFTQPTDVNYHRTITHIVATDQYTNGNGGYATLVDGGPSTNYAKLHLKSQRNHGFNFVIDIYGQ